MYSGLLPLEPAAGGRTDDRLLVWADDRTQASFWAGSVGAADAQTALRQSPRGFGVVALTELMISDETLGDFIDAINDLGQQPDRKSTQDRLACLAYQACQRLMLESAGTPIDLRLPNLGSPRAQRMIGSWASLAPRLFLPLGLKGLYVALLRGIADAARETGHAQTTPLVPGITATSELQPSGAPQRASTEQVGVVLQSPAGIAEAGGIAEGASAVWVDLREIIRTYYGYPSALSFADDVFETYVADGYLTHNPRTTLGSKLAELFAGVAAAAARRPEVRIGVECGDGAALGLIEDLYRSGIRLFSLPTAALPSARLALGQLAVEES